jgi:hypothetical protein
MGMNRMTMIAGWLAVCLVLAAGPVRGVAVAAPALGAPGEAVARPAQYEAEEEGPAEPEPGFRGALDLRIQSLEGRPYSPAEMVISNPFGETAGYDPRADYTYGEIPGGDYWWEEIPGTASNASVLYIRNAVSGTYSLRLIGTDYGTYRLAMKGYDRYSSHADVEFTMRIEPGAVHHYLVSYSNRGGARIDARRTRVIH